MSLSLVVLVVVDEADSPHHREGWIEIVDQQQDVGRQHEQHELEHPFRKRSLLSWALWKPEQQHVDEL